MNILSINASDYSEILKAKKSKADVILINYHSVVCFNMTVGVPTAVRAAREVSLFTGADVLLHAALDIEGEKFLSVMVIKNAELIGVSDCISNDMYTQGRALRMYDVCKVRTGISVDKDFLYSGAGNFFNAGAGMVIHFTLNELNKEYFGAYKSHMRLTDGFFIGLFKDCLLVGDKIIKILPQGEETEIILPDRKFAANSAFLKLSKG